jgi:guanine deaminase
VGPEDSADYFSLPAGKCLPAAATHCTGCADKLIDSGTCQSVYKHSIAYSEIRGTIGYLKRAMHPVLEMVGIIYAGTSSGQPILPFDIPSNSKMPTQTRDNFFDESIDPLCYTEIRYTTYFGTFVHTPELGVLDVLHHTAIGVDTNGTIDFVVSVPSDSNFAIMNDLILRQLTLQHTSCRLLSEDKIDVVNISREENKFFFPGFIDTHIHAPQFPNNGIFGNSTLLEWLETYTFPLESSFKDLNFASEIYKKVIKRTLQNGTTTASYYATIHTDATNLLADLCLKMGQRSYIGKVCMNHSSPDHYIETTEETQESTLKVIDHIKARNPSRDLVNPIITPRFAGSCTDDLLKWLGRLRKAGDYHCQTHLSENHKEIEWIMSMFPQYKNYTDIYYQTHLLSSKTVLAHCIHLSDDEMKMIQQTGSGVSHCPTSNSSITSGEARVRWLLDNQINVSLGTDCSGGFTPSILEVAKHALLVSRHLVMETKDDREKLSSADVLYLSTVGGAKVLDMENQVGCFKKGLKFDAQMINIGAENSNIDTFSFQNPQWGQLPKDESLLKFQNLIDKWLFNGDDRNIEKVYVNGRTVINNI